MPEQLSGFPYWELRFDESGRLVDSRAAGALVEELPGQGLTDLFVFSHGWNNDRGMARDLYERYFAEMRALLDRSDLPGTRREAAIGTVGVIWPSMRWEDEALPPAAGAAGGAAGLGAARAPASDGHVVKQLKAVFPDAKHQKILDELAGLLDTRPRSDAELERFKRLMRELAAGPDVTDSPEESGEQTGLLKDDLRRGESLEVFERFGSAAEAQGSEGGAAGLGDRFARLWAGAKEALRAASYWQMKKRAGIVGKEGLGPLLGRVHTAQPDLRIHLLGHSFGARLVSFALAGLPINPAEASPIKSVTLLQGAFSHFAFADALPHDRARGGALKGMASHVDGPITISHSTFDTAVGTAYPLASIVSLDDASAAEDLTFRWGAMGHDGAQGVESANLPLGRVGQTYPFGRGKIVNLDGNAIIREGGPPAGAHGDIFHPQLAWATLAAAGVVAP